MPKIHPKESNSLPHQTLLLNLFVVLASDVATSLYKIFSLSLLCDYFGTLQTKTGHSRPFRGALKRWGLKQSILDRTL